MQTLRQRKTSIDGDRLPPILSSPHQHSNSVSTTSQPNPLPSGDFQVCEDCQKILLDSYNHCLHRNVEADAAQMPSLLDFDETDNPQIHSPPEYRVVRDPTTLLGNSDQKRTAIHHNTQTLEGSHFRNDPGHSRMQSHVKNSQQDNYENDSNLHKESKMTISSFKTVLLAKNKEIAQLKQKLYETSLVERIEHSNVEKMQRALGKAVRYYALAENWKDLETKQLQDKVVGLKSYVCSLMAFLLNNDEYRKQLDEQIRVLTDRLSISDAIVSKNDSVVSALKQKLSHAYTEFVDLTNDYDNLTANSTSIEALYATQKQVEAMAVQYLSVTKDLVQVSKNFEEKTLKLRHLEFECEELVKQFNTLGVAHAKLVESNDTLVEEHRVRMLELEKLKIFNGVTVKAKNIAESSLALLTRVHDSLVEKTKQEQEEASDIISNQKNEIAEFKETNVRLTNDLSEQTQYGITQTTALKNVEELLQTTHSTFIRDVLIKDKHIADLTGRENTIVEDRNAYKSKNDDLIMKVNELHLVIETETQQTRSISLEMKEMRTSLAQSMTNFHEESIKLNKSKDALTRDKVNLADEVRELRKKLDATDVTMSKVVLANRQVLNLQKAEYSKLDISHTLKCKDFVSLTLLYDNQTLDLKESRAINVERSDKITLLSSELVETNSTLALSNTNAANLSTRLKSMTAEKESYLNKWNTTTKKLADVTKDLNATLSKLNLLKLESADSIATMTSKISSLDSQVEFDAKLALENRAELLHQTQETKLTKSFLKEKITQFENERIERETIQDILNMKIIELSEERLMKDEAQKSLFQMRKDGANIEGLEDMDMKSKQTRLGNIGGILADERERLRMFLELIPETVFDVKV